LSDDQFVTPERERLAEAVRHLVDAVLTCEDATEEQLGTAADAAEGIASRLGRLPHDDDRRPRGVRTRMERDHADYLPRSPLVGEVSPLAPPIEWEFVDGRIRGRGVYHAAYEGPPGYVHGGWVALTFDEILGMANIASGHPGMTGTLKVRYLLPTPLHTPVTLEGWTERVEGRRIVAKGRLLVDGRVTAEAEGLFVVIDAARAAAYFGAARAEAAPTGAADA
jgi:acyl-coenzyme A thioesterase PaaI-like protein